MNTKLKRISVNAVKSITIYNGVKQTMIMAIHEELTFSFRAVFISSHALRVPRMTLKTFIPLKPNWAKGELRMVYKGRPHGSRKSFG